MAAPVLVSSHTAYRGALTIAGDGGLVDLGFMLLAVGSSDPTSWSITLTSGTSGHWTTPTDGTFPTPTSTGDTADLNGGPYVFDVTATNADGTSNTCVLTINIRADTYTISSPADWTAARGSANSTTLCGKTAEIARACTGFVSASLVVADHNTSESGTGYHTITNEDNDYPADVLRVRVMNSARVKLVGLKTITTRAQTGGHYHIENTSGLTSNLIEINDALIRGPVGEVENTRNGIYIYPGITGEYTIRNVDMQWVSNGFAASPNGTLKIYGGKIRYFTSNGVQTNTPDLTIHDLIIMSPMRDTSNAVSPGQDHVDYIQLSDSATVDHDIQRLWLVHADGDATCTFQSGTLVQSGVIKNVVMTSAALDAYGPMVNRGNGLDMSCITSINQVAFPNLTTTATAWGDKYTAAGSGGGEPWVRFVGTHTSVTASRIWAGDNVGGTLTGVTLGDGVLEWRRYTSGGVQTAYDPSTVFQDYAALSTIDYTSADTDGIIAALQAALSPSTTGAAKLSDNSYSTALYPDGGWNLGLPYATKYTLTPSVSEVEEDGSAIITANLLDEDDVSAVRGVDLVITLTEGGASGNTGTYQITIPAGENSGQVTATDAGTGAGSWTFTATTPTDLTDPAALDVPVTGGSMALLDNFTDTNGTGLGSHTSDSGHTWTQISGTGSIQSNRLWTATNPGRFQSSWTPASADYDVEGVGERITDTSASIYVMGRYTDNNNRYWGGWSGTQWVIGKSQGGSVNGSLAVGSSGVPSVGVPFTIKLEMRGTTIKLYLNGVEECSVVDSPGVTGAGHPGLSLGGSTSTTGSHFDSISATDASTGSVSIPVLMNHYLQQGIR